MGEGCVNEQVTTDTTGTHSQWGSPGKGKKNVWVLKPGSKEARLWILQCLSLFNIQLKYYLFTNAPYSIKSLAPPSCSIHIQGILLWPEKASRRRVTGPCKWELCSLVGKGKAKDQGQGTNGVCYGHLQVPSTGNTKTLLLPLWN